MSGLIFDVYGGLASFSIGPFTFVDGSLVSGVISCAGLALFQVLGDRILVLDVISCAGPVFSIRVRVVWL